jgi:hypothetical protein
MWMTLVVVCWGGGPELHRPAVDVAGTRSRAESVNFAVACRSPQHDAREAARQCELLREAMCRKWCSDSAGNWTPKCQVVIHAGGRDYLAAVGSGGSRTYGSSLLDFDGDGVSRRQIDLRGDSPAGMAALPHELTHVVLADLLGRQPPRWADEGLALLADKPEKRRLHERDLLRALAAGRAFRLGELLTLDAYPHPSRVPAFYGQSASLAALLTSRDEPHRFVEFLKHSHEHGYDAALKHVYAIDGVSQLERLWLKEMTTDH